MSIDVSALAIKVTSDGIKEASSSLSGLSTSANNAEKRVTAFTNAMTTLNNISKSSITSMDGYMLKLREQATLMESLRNNSTQASSSTAALASAMALLAASLNNVNAQTVAASASQRRHNESMAEAHALARGLSGSLGALWMTYGNLAGMAVGVGIGATLKQVVSQGTDVEHVLEGIRVRGSETVDSVDKIRESVLELGKGVYGPLQVANAFETLILAGLRADQALESINAALNLATVGGTSIEKAATTLVSVGTAVGYTAEGFSRVGDVIAKTAALSMSSVESLSEAFKSASSVSKLYGVSLVDIGTALGVLSNLGIQGSAAGTALKNFYKELSSEGDKVVDTLKIIGATPIKLKDAAGNYKPLLDVVKELDAGLSKLSESEEKTAIARLSNERGLRLLVQALGLYREKLEDGSNALQKFHDDAENSYAFAAQGAVQMALTAKSQITSMSNTLKTVFVDTFKSVEPEIVLFTQHMKAAFNSKEFKEGILNIASGFGRLALTISENIPLLTAFAAGLVAVKAGMIVHTLFTAAGTALAAMGTALTAATAGSLTLSAALGPLGIVLGTITAAWVAYNIAKNDAQSEKSAAVAAAYSRSFIDGLTKEAERLQIVTEKMKQHKSVAEANAEAERNLALDEMKRTDQKAVAAAKAEVAAERQKLVQRGIRDIDSITTSSQISGVTEYITALQKQDRAVINAANNLKLAEAATRTLTNAGKEHAAELERQAKAARQGSDRNVTATLADAPKAEQLTTYQKLVKAIDDKVAADEEQFNVSQKLTWAERQLVGFQREMAEGLTRLTPKEQASIETKLKAAAINSRLLEDQKDYLKTSHEQRDADIKSVEQAEKEVEKRERAVATYHMTKEAIGQMELARLQEQLRQKESLGLCDSETIKLEKLIDLKRRELTADAALDKMAAEKARLHPKKAGSAEEAIKKYADEAADQGVAVGQAWTHGMKMAEDALVDFVKTGKLNISSLADFIITEMLRSQIKQFLGTGGDSGMGLLGSLGSAIFGGGATGAFGFNAGVAASQGLTMADIGSAFAGGGDPPVGKVSLVGEEGPELFVPKQAGTIIPNDQLGGGGSINITSAPVIHIDARSDQAQIRQMVQSATAQSNAELVEKLQRAGKIR